MNGRSQNRSFLTTTVVQPPVVNHNYPYANSVNSDNDVLEEDTELYELRSRGREKIRRSTSRDRLDDIVYITKEIQEGDTLNAIALHHCCSVADIKRANSFISEQDFFALRSIKIPVKKFSFLTETNFLHVSRTAPPHVYLDPQESAAALNAVFPNRSAGNFLQDVDRDIEQILKNTDTKRENLNEVVSALSTQAICFEPVRTGGKRKDPHYGADWGMRWWTAVIIMLVVGIITPVFYLLYYEYLMKADVSHHNSDSPPVLDRTPLPQEADSDVPPVKTISNDIEKDHKHFSVNTQGNVHRPTT